MRVLGLALVRVLALALLVTPLGTSLAGSLGGPLGGPLAGSLRAQTISLPLHGHWCGLGHGGQTDSMGGGAQPLPPTDALDNACMHHDICTGQFGRLDCGCDIGFMQHLRGQAWPNPGLQAKARAVYDTIAIMPCRDPRGMMIKANMVTRDWAGGVLSGRETPWDILRRLGYLNGQGWERGGWRP